LTFVAAVVFNLALAYHFAAGSCPNMIKIAEWLYDMVLQILDSDTTTCLADKILARLQCWRQCSMLIPVLDPNGDDDDGVDNALMQ
jgi:hypothetical protein